LVVLDYDYEAHERTPYDLSFDRVVALGTVDFLGSDALKTVAAHPPVVSRHSAWRATSFPSMASK